MPPTLPTRLNPQGAAAARRVDRAARAPIPQAPRIGQNREVFHSVMEIANGLFRRRPVPMEIDTPFDPSALGLKEIGNLASWTVSSCKPGCGVEALRDEDTGLFWQCVFKQPIQDYQNTDAMLLQIRRSSTTSSEHPLLSPCVNCLYPNLPRLRS